MLNINPATETGYCPESIIVTGARLAGCIKNQIMETYIFLGVLVLVVLIVVSAGVKIVPQSETRVIERLGRFHSVLSPGLNII